MRTGNPMSIRRQALRWACALAALGALAVRAATVMVLDVDVRGKQVGDPIEMPVRIAGANVSSFGAFVLDFAYDHADLRFDAVERGPLLSATGAASREQAPYLWALETSLDAAAGRLRVAGMILGQDPEDNTTAGMAAARLASSDGVLLVLHFTLLALDAAPVAVVPDSEAGRSALVDDDEGGSTAAEPVGAELVAGGALVDGMPNWWALEHFGDPEHDPEADDDADWRRNVEEYDEGTDPTVPDQRLSFQPGWNMLGFRTVPDLTPVEWVAALNAAAGRDAREGEMLSATVYYFDPGKLRYVLPNAFEAGKAYWFYAFAAGEAEFVGTAVPADYSVTGANGWQMVALPENRTKAGIGGDVQKCQAWDAENQQYGPDTEDLEAVLGHWIYRRPAR